jgi:hypothetical protein
MMAHPSYELALASRGNDSPPNRGRSAGSEWAGSSLRLQAVRRPTSLKRRLPRDGGEAEGSANQVRQTQADAQDAQAANEQSFPLPTVPTRQHQPDGTQDRAKDERRGARDARRDQPWLRAYWVPPYVTATVSTYPSSQ